MSKDPRPRGTGQSGGRTGDECCHVGPDALPGLTISEGRHQLQVPSGGSAPTRSMLPRRRLG